MVVTICGTWCRGLGAGVFCLVSCCSRGDWRRGCRGPRLGGGGWIAGAGGLRRTTRGRAMPTCSRSAVRTTSTVGVALVGSRGACAIVYRCGHDRRTSHARESRAVVPYLGDVELPFLLIGVELVRAFVVVGELASAVAERVFGVTLVLVENVRHAQDLRGLARPGSGWAPARTGTGSAQRSLTGCGHERPDLVESYMPCHLRGMAALAMRA